jgi:hypothetical protein
MKPSNSYPQLSRPKSFSEGYGVINHFPKYEEHILENTDYTDAVSTDAVSTEEIPEESKKDYVEIIYNKIVAFSFHLLLIATFELIFFNYYIIQYENNAVVSLSNSLIQPMINSCLVLSNTSKVIIDSFISIFVNQTIIDNNAFSDKNNREINNKYISYLSIVYYSIIISGFILLLLTNLILRKKIDFVMILIDNLIMICILGSYEYLFFHNIIFKYLTLGPNELIKNIMGNILSSC